MILRTLGLDFVRQTPRRSVWTRLSVAVAAVALLAAGVFFLDVLSSHSFLQADYSRKQAQSGRREPPEMSANEHRVLLEKIKGVNPYIKKLNLPWDAIFTAVTPPRALPVDILGLEVTGQADGLRISAVAGRPEDVTDYVAYLGEKSLFREVFLLQHEIQADGRFRFDVEAQWVGKY